ncbi:MAG: FAD-dependent oxidoreductase [Clostridia bacterium]|nr:FAD-dependent oxidoreductase [Clostridia bacterium]
METNYDIIIIGCGPAGMTAGIYAKRAGMKCLILEKLTPGGQITITPSVENYTGFKKIDGIGLSQKMFEQVSEIGVDVVFSECYSVSLKENLKEIKTKSGVFKAPAIILAMGAASRALGTEEDKKFVGKGLSYCAVCDGAFFKDKTVAVVGGGNTALEDIAYISNIAKSVVHINRRSEFRADELNIENYNKLLKQENSKIKQYLGYVVEKLYGDAKLESIDIRNISTGEVKNLKLDGVFVSIGRVPQTEILDSDLKLDESGYIIVNDKMETSIEGVFACGDITHKTLRQISTAVGDGSIAGTYASVYVKKHR